MIRQDYYYYFTSISRHYLKSDKDCSENAEFQVNVTGKFEGIPDSGRAVVKKKLSIEMKAEGQPQGCPNVDYTKESVDQLAVQVCPDVDYSQLEKHNDSISVWYSNSTGLWGLFITFPNSCQTKGSLEMGCYRHGQKTGHWIHYFGNGELDYEGNYTDDNKTGHWTYWSGEKDY
jgi:hypothetical protein